jgi:PD-(D/E)XK nuclease superfamily protein
MVSARAHERPSRAIAELAIAREAVSLGIDVCRPLAEGGRYDLIMEIRSQLFRVQCTYARRHDEVVRVRCYSTRRAREGLRKRTYRAAAEVDLIAAYCPGVDPCFLLDADHFDGRTQVDLRVGASRNKQSLRVNLGRRLRIRG